MGGPSEAIHSRRRVLLVDDDEDVRETVRLVLERSGFEVDEAADGEQALACLQRSPREPCIILVDLMMPKMDGWQLIRALRTDDRLYALPVVVVSAVPELVPNGVKVIRKPFALDELIRVVDEHCASG